MKKKIELTNALLHKVGSLEVYHDLVIPLELPQIYEVNIWGIDLNPYELGLTEEEQDDVYVSGFSKLTFINPTYIKMNFSPYKDDSGQSFMTDQNGNHIRFQKEWGNGDGLKDTDMFVYGGIILFPFSNGEHYIAAEKVLLEIDTEHFVSLREYSLNPQLYTYKNKQLFKPRNMSSYIDYYGPVFVKGKGYDSRNVAESMSKVLHYADKLEKEHGELQYGFIWNKEGTEAYAVFYTEIFEEKEAIKWLQGKGISLGI